MVSKGLIFWGFVAEFDGLVDFWNWVLEILLFSGFGMILKFHFNGRCDHEQIKNAEGCIVEIIGENNPDHFYVGTQDTDMRKKFQEVSFFFFLFKLFYMIFGC
jgi:Ca2+/Na+ antiporter